MHDSRAQGFGLRVSIGSRDEKPAAQIFEMTVIFGIFVLAFPVVGSVFSATIPRLLPESCIHDPKS